MAGPYLLVKKELGLAFKKAWGVTVGWPWSPLAPENSPVVGRDTPHLAGI